MKGENAPLLSFVSFLCFFCDMMKTGPSEYSFTVVGICALAGTYWLMSERHDKFWCLRRKGGTGDDSIYTGTL